MRRLVLLFVLMVAAMPAQAQVYGELNYANIAKTLLRFGAVNPAKDNVLDDYFKLTDCPRYVKSYRDDFAMQKWRQEIRSNMKTIAADFPDSYFFKSKMYLDKYDFEAKAYPLTKGSQLRNVNSFELLNAVNQAACIAGQFVETIPGNVGAVLDQPIKLVAIPMSEDKAAALLKRMNDAGNVNREVYVRFSLMIAFAPPVGSNTSSNRYNMDAQLLAIEFFEDKEYTKPIWVFTRS